MESSQPKRPPVFTSRYRAASPVLRTLQLQSAHRPLPDILATHKASFIEKAKQVLEQYGLVEGDDTKVDLLHRQQSPYGREPIATLYITTPWKKSTADLWPRAVEDIKVFMDSVIQGPRGLTEAEWDSVRAMVRENLDSFEATKDQWTTVALFKLGYSENMEENPNTIYVSLSYDSDEMKWEEVMVKIEKELQEMNLGFLELHFEHNEGWNEFFGND
ncbi:hypothetical protein ACHAPT_007633 [Fusarium lateritium]